MGVDGKTGRRPHPRDIDVLLVSGDPAADRGHRQALEAAGDRLTVSAAPTAREALDRLTATDCVVSSLGPPGTEDFGFLEAVREQAPSLPVILRVDPEREGVVEEALATGATECIPAGLGAAAPAMLANRIERVVSGSRLQAAVDPSTQRDRRLVRESADVIAIVDEQGRFEYVSPSAERVLGYAPETLLDEPGLEYIHPDDREEVTERFGRLIDESEERSRAEFRFHRPDGSGVWLEGRGRNLLDDTAIEGIVVYTRDVTERKERERELRESELRYRRLLESSPGPVFIYSADGELVYVNDAGVDLLGADDRAAVIGTTSGDFTHPDARPTVEDRYQRLVVEREPVPPVELKLQGVDGETKYATMASSPVTYEGAPAIQTVGMDITDAKERERELQRQTERLDEFATVVSHDLRNPLNVATGRLELAAEDCDSPHLDAIAEAHDRMASLIDDVLTLARHGNDVESMTDVDLATVVRDCWGTVETSEASLELTTDATVRAEPSRLRQLIENLLRNAVDHVDEELSIRVGDLEGGFYVEDDGPGIPPAERSEIFTPGYSTAEDGTGFGLKIVREIVEAHGWAIDVCEGTAGGARFEITGVEMA